ncbi:MAG: 1-phosphofructokinase [Clostridia bacterium]|nr:1-phosphofructokinase [Clostridia bacterium]
MIYTVTFNPALDYVVFLSRLEEGQTNRAQKEELYFGGKGINVSLVLKELGVENTALGFIAGFTGEALEAGLLKKGIKADFIRLPEGRTRINLKLKAEKETEINAGGPEIPKEALAAMMEKLGALKEGDFLVLAGSVPASVPKDIYSEMMGALAGKGVRCVVDATGSLLENGLPYKPFLIKPNHRELEELAGRALPTREEIANAAAELREKGAQNVLVSLGSEGALLLDEQGKIHTMPAVGGKPVNTVGAGDSMVAGFLAGLDRGYEYALKLASAAGGATASSEDLAIAPKIAELMKEID